METKVYKKGVNVVVERSDFNNHYIPTRSARMQPHNDTIQITDQETGWSVHIDQADIRNELNESFATIDLAIDYLTEFVGSFNLGGPSGQNPSEALFTTTADNYTQLTGTDGSNIGDLAYVFNEQGTKWLPGGLGGTYYSKGVYVWDGVDWVSDRVAISEQLQQNINELLEVQPSGNLGDIQYNEGDGTFGSTPDLSWNDTSKLLGVNGNIQSTRFITAGGNPNQYVKGDGTLGILADDIPDAPVDSVNGQTGIVVLDKDDVGLNNVDNTSDENKPVSTATQLALDGKVDDSQVLTNVPAGAVFTDTIYDDSQVNNDISTLNSQQNIQDTAIALNTAKISATGNELEASDIDTLSELNSIITDATLIDTNDSRLSDARTPLAHTHTKSEITDFSDSDYATASQGVLADSALQSVQQGANITIDNTDPQNPIISSTASGGGVTTDPDPQTNLAGTANDGDLAYDTTDKELQVFNGDLGEFVNPAQSDAQAEQSASVAAGSTLGLQQQLLAEAGQPALTVLAVGNTNTGKVQGISLGDGNVIEVYASGATFNEGTVLYREFMSLGEPICFTGLSNGAIITSTQGFYGFSEQLSGANESPMPLLSYGLSFDFTFFFGFRNFGSPTVLNEGLIYVVNGAIANTIKLTDGSGNVIDGQENIKLDPWEFVELHGTGVREYILEGKERMMACTAANMDVNGFYDSRLIMPLSNDLISYPRSGDFSTPFQNVVTNYFVRDGAQGTFTTSAGSPTPIDSATGATDSDYEPNGATRTLINGLGTWYSGADSAGLEATPAMPVSGMSQVVAQPLFIADNGDGGNSGVAIASPYEGEAKIYSWNTGTNSLVLEYTVPLTRNGVTILSKEDQKHPSAGLVANEATGIQLVGQLDAGVIIADVPITVIVQNETPTLVPTIRSQNGTTTTAIVSDDDETLSLGWTPETIKAEIREGSDGILYKRVIGTGGIDTWVVA